MGHNSGAFAMVPTRANEVRPGDLLIAQALPGADIVSLVMAVETDESTDRTYLDVAECLAGPMTMGDCADKRMDFDSIAVLVKLAALDPEDLI